MDVGLSRYSAGSHRVVLRVICNLKCHCFRFGDVCLLGLFGSCGEQEEQPLSLLHQIDAITGPVIDSQLAHALADRLDVAQVAKRKAADSNLNAGSGLFVAKFAKPTGEKVSLANLDHALTIIHSHCFGQVQGNELCRRQWPWPGSRQERGAGQRERAAIERGREPSCGEERVARRQRRGQRWRWAWVLRNDGRDAKRCGGGLETLIECPEACGRCQQSGSEQVRIHQADSTRVERVRFNHAPDLKCGGDPRLRQKIQIGKGSSAIFD